MSDSKSPSDDIAEPPNEVSSKNLSDYVDLIKQNPTMVLLSLAGIYLLFTTISGVYKRELFFNFSGLIISSIYLGALYLCLSLGLTLTYKLLGFANFAHAEYFLVGAYTGVAWTIGHPLQKAQLSDVVFVLIIAFAVGGAVALISDLLVFRPLRKIGSSNETLMISSIGVGIVIRNIVSLLYGGQTSYYRWFDFNSHDMSSTVPVRTIWLGGRVNFIEAQVYQVPLAYIVTIVVSILLVGGLIYMLQYTKIGKALRATSDNRNLAESSGINTERMIWLVWFIGGGLAACAGVLYVLSFGVIPYTGFLFLLPAFAVVVFGGVGSLKGSIVASLLIAFFQQISTTYLGGLEAVLARINVTRTGLSAYQVAVPFLIIILVLFFKPFGLYGEEEAS